jgi:hypothetical protein
MARVAVIRLVAQMCPTVRAPPRRAQRTDTTATYLGRAHNSRNLLFHSGRPMDEIFQALIDRTRGPLNLDRIKTIFGDKSRPHYDKRKKNPTRWGVVVEKPAYDWKTFPSLHT